MPQNLLFVEVTKFLIGVSFSVSVTPMSDHEGPILSYKGTLSGHKSPCLSGNKGPHSGKKGTPVWRKKPLSGHMWVLCQAI